ncbi:MAG: glycosyltransferase family 9 protein [bacterium]
MKKALVIRFSSAGDILLTRQVIVNLQKSGYQAHLICKEKFIKAGEAVKPDRTIKYSDNFFALVSILSAEKYDVIVDLQRNLKSFLLRLLIKAKIKKLYNKDSVKRRLMVLFKWFLSDKTSVTDKYLQAVSKLTGLKLIPSKVINLKSKRVINILIHAGAKWKNKRWPFIADLIPELLKFKKVRVVLTGVKDEVDSTMLSLYNKDKRVRNIIGKTDFSSLLKEIAKTDVFIGNDTAAAHASKLYGKLALIFLGPTVSAFGFITNKDYIIMENHELMCRPCHLHGGDKCPIDSFDCMKSITVAMVIDKIKKIII